MRYYRPRRYRGIRFSDPKFDAKKADNYALECLISVENAIKEANTAMEALRNIDDKKAAETHGLVLDVRNTLRELWKKAKRASGNAEELKRKYGA